MANKISVEVDVNTKEVKFAGGDVTRLAQQVRVLTEELNKMQAAGQVGSEKYQILVEKLNDTRDAMDRTKLAAGEIYGTLSAMPGPIGEVGRSLNTTIDSFKLLGSLKTTELRAQFTGLLKDVKESGQGFLNFIGFTKLYEKSLATITASKNKDTVATVANTEATTVSTVAENKKSAAIATDTVVTNVNTAATVTATVAARALAIALAALPFVAIASAIGLVIAYWDDLVDAMTGATAESKAYKAAQEDVIKVTSEFEAKLSRVKDNVKLAKQGFVDKKDALKEYNDELGDSIGYAKDLNEAEQLLVTNAPIYLQILSKKAEMEFFYARAAEASAKLRTGKDLEPGFWQKTWNFVKAGGNAFVAVGYDIESYGENIQAATSDMELFNKMAGENALAIAGLQKEIDKTRKPKPEDKTPAKPKTQEEKDKELIEGLNRSIDLEVNSENTKRKKLEELLNQRRALNQKYQKLNAEDYANALEADRKLLEKAMADDANVRIKKGEDLIKGTRENSQKIADESLRSLQSGLDKELQAIDIEENKKKEKKGLKEREITQIEIDARVKREQAQLVFLEKQLAIINGQKEEELKIVEQAVKDLIITEEDAVNLRLGIASTYADKIFAKEREIGKTKVDIVVNASKDIAKANKQETTDATNALDDKIKLLQLQSESLLQGTRAYYDLRREIIDAAEKKELANTELTEAEITAIQKKYSAQRKQTKQEELNTTLQFISQGFDAAKGVADAILAVSSANQTEELELAKATISDKKELAIAQDEINRKYFDKNKGAQKALAYISALQGAISAFASLAPIPLVGPYLGGIAAAAALVAGRANVRKIEATTYQSTIDSDGDAPKVVGTTFAKGGLLKGPSHSDGGIKTKFGELEGGEYVINRKSTASFLPLITAINSAGNRKYQEGGMMANMDTIQAMMASQQAPIIKTYVVASDMTSQQEANKKLMDLAKI